MSDPSIRETARYVPSQAHLGQAHVGQPRLGRPCIDLTDRPVATFSLGH